MGIRALIRNLFLLSFSNELLSMGLIIWAGMRATAPIQQTVWIATWAAAGYILAIFINLGGHAKLNRRMLAVGTLIATGTVLALYRHQAFWGFAILLRCALGQVTYARFATLVPELVPKNEVPRQSKFAQLAGTFGVVVSMAASPLLANRFGLDGVLGLAILLLIPVIAERSAFNGGFADPVASTDGLRRRLQHASSWFNGTALLLFITWMIFGDILRN